MTPFVKKRLLLTSSIDVQSGDFIQTSVMDDFPVEDEDEDEEETSEGDFISDNPIQELRDALNRFAGNRESMAWYERIIRQTQFNWFSSIPELLDLLENVIIFLDHFSLAKKRRSQMCAITGFVKSQVIGGGSIIRKTSSYLFTKILSIWSDYEVQSGQPEFISAMKNALGTIDRTKNSQFVHKMRTTIAYLIGYGILSKSDVRIGKHSDRFDVLAYEVAKRPFANGVNFLQVMLDFSIFICEKGYVYMRTGNFHHFFLDEDSTNEWLDLSVRLLRDAEFLNDAEIHNMDEAKYQVDLDKAIDTGTSLLKYSSDMYIGEKRAIKNALNQLHVTKQRLSATLKALRRRRAPMGLLLAAGSSVGKSFLTQLLYTVYAKVSTIEGHPLVANEDHKYVLNSANENWDKFKSSRWFINLDDVAYQLPSQATGVDETLKEVLRIFNNTPYLPRQAALEDKGATPCLAKFCLATSNTEDLCAQFYFNCPYAIMRRFKFVVVPEVKDEFATSVNGVKTLDPTKTTAPEEGFYPNFWNFTIKRVEPVIGRASGTNPRQLAKLVPCEQFSHIDDFVAWFGIQVRQHIGQEDVIEAAMTNLDTVTLCNKCYKPSDGLCCADVQSPGFDLAWERFSAVVSRHIGNDTTFFLRIMVNICFPIYLFITLFMPFGVVSLLPWLCMVIKVLVSGNLLSWFSPKAWLIWLVYWICVCISSFCIGALYLLDVIPGARNVQPYPVIMLKVFLSWTLWHTRRRILHQMTCRFRRMTYGGGYKLLAWAGAFGVMLALWRIASSGKRKKRKRKYAVQGAAGSKPVADKQEPPVIWRNDELRVTSFDLSPGITSRSKFSITQLKHLFAQQCYGLRVHRGEEHLPGRILALGGHLWVTNRHYFVEGFDSIELIADGTDHGVNRNRLIRNPRIFYVPERDLAFIDVPDIPPKKKIFDLFLKEPWRLRCDAYLMGRRPGGDMITRKISSITWLENQVYLHKEGLNDKYPVYGGRTTIPTQDGDCGSIVWSKLENVGPAILGIHVAGRNDAQVTMPIFQGDVNSAIAYFGTPIVQSGEPSLVKPLLPLHARSGTRYIQQGTADIYGTMRGYLKRTHSRVQSTIIGEAIVKRSNESLFPIEFNTGPPEMSHFRPWRLAMDKMLNTNQDIDQEALHICAEAFLSNILERLPSEELRKIEVYDYNTAVNGAPGVTYVDKVNRKSSAGHPWGKSKQYLSIKLAPFDDYQDPIDFTPDVKERYSDLLSKYKQGIRGHPVFTAHLKDEPVSLKKVREKKTRVFCGAPLDFTLVVRRYLLSVIRVIQRNRYVFECAVGAVAQSAQWNELYEHLTAFGTDSIVAGDYAAFDKTMPPSVMRAAFKILLSLCSAAGYSDEDLTVVATIMEDTSFPNVDICSDLIQFYGTNPSGHPLTVIINSIANSLYMRYAYMILGKEHGVDVESFQKKVNLMTYGDDNIMGVSESAPWFNHTNIMQTLAGIGIVYTMADKNAESIPFINIREASFLKRDFHFDPDIGTYVGRLDHASISKMLTMRVAERGVHPKEHAASVVRTAMEEYFWYGREVYRKQGKFLQRIINEFGLQEYTSGDIITGWPQLYKRFVEISARLGFNPQDIVSRHSQGTVPLEIESLLLGMDCVTTYKSLANSIPEESDEDIVESDSCEDEPLHAIDPKSTLKMSWAHRNRGSDRDENLSQAIMEREPVPSGETVWDNVIRHGPPEDIFYVQSGEPITIPQERSSGNVTSNVGDADETVPQSTSLLTDSVNTERQQIVEFVGDTPSPAVEFQPVVDPTFTGDYTPSAELAEFLMRPVKIQTITWTEGSPYTNVSIQPWHLFLNNAIIKRKIDNYNFLSATLKIKAVVNASPFYYGAMLIAYTPLPAFYSDDGLVTSGTNLPVHLTQKPHIWVLPQNNQGGELELPFFYNRNWLDITSAADLQAMGELEFYEVQALQNANGVSADSININIYAWMENVKLTGPTYDVSVQSGKPRKNGKKKASADDEYSVGPVEKVSSIVASAAGYLTETPVIGPFARVTELGASAVSHLAKIFGWTNPPVICNVTPVRNAPFHSFPSTEIGDAVDKLTLDPKNELCIDPRTVGLGVGDEMSLAYICGKEALLCKTTWESSYSTDSLIFSCPVQPTMYAIDTSFGANSQPVYMTPMCLIAQQFKQWRGDLEFRIQAICTQYHKGRLRITWDPSSDLVANSDTTSTSFTKILDLEPEMNVTFRVSYLQGRHWLFCRDLSEKRNYWRVSGDIFANEQVDGYTNGSLTIRVLNELSSPVATSSVQLFVFVKGCSNLEFCNPENQIPLDFSYFVAQSGMWEESGDCIAIQGNKSKTVYPEQYHVYAGECVKSLRTLLRRTSLETGYNLGVISYDAAANMHVIKCAQTKYPSAVGYDPKAYHFAASINAGPNAPYNFTSHTPFTDVVPCYVGMRGTMRWQYNFDLGQSEYTTVNTVKVDRLTNQVPIQGGGNINLITDDKVTTLYTFGGTPYIFQNMPQGTAGMSLNNTRTQTGIAVEYPHYYRTRFVGTDKAHWTVGSSVDDTDKESYDVVSIWKKSPNAKSPADNVIFEKYYSIGTDFTTFFFLAVPIMYAYTSRPVPA